MSGCIRQRLGPTKKRLKERIEQTQTFLQQQITLDESEGKANELLLKLERNLKSYKDLLEQLQEASKDNEAKTQRLVAEMEEFSILTLDGDDAICDLKLSHLGWILSGRLLTEERKTSEHSMFLMGGHSCQQYQQSFIPENSEVFMKPNLDEFWKLETIGIKDPVNDCDDDQAIQNFHETVRKTNGRYEVTWPWKKAYPRLPDNYQLALGRLNSLLKRIQGKPELLQKYEGIIKDQLKKEIIEEVNDRTEEGCKKTLHSSPCCDYP